MTPRCAALRRAAPQCLQFALPFLALTAEDANAPGCRPSMGPSGCGRGKPGPGADVAKVDLFLRIGVSFGSRSLMGGVIFVMPITFTIAFNAPRIDPSTCDEAALTDRVIQREHGIRTKILSWDRRVDMKPDCKAQR